jgi:hypothetical protein
VNRKDDSKENGEEVKRDLHVLSPGSRKLSARTKLSLAPVVPL